MGQDVLISVIVPIYNLENYIERCVKSILSQTYTNLEIILVNDGSVDRSWKVITKLAEMDPRIVMIDKENGGVTSARLAGIQVAKGEWIGFVDGDDEIEADMYELLLGNALKYHADISHCGYQMVFEDGRINYFYNTGCIVSQDSITAVKDLLEGTFVEPGLGNKLFCKSLFKNLVDSELMDIKIKINEDLLMNYYLFLNSKILVYEDFCPYHYMIRGNSASRSKLNENKIYDPINVKQIIYDSAPVEIKHTAKKMYISTCVNVYNSLMIKKGYKKEKRDVYRLIYREKAYYNLLNRRIKLLARLICYVPILYPMLYKIYVNFFQKKKYD